MAPGLGPKNSATGTERIFRALQVPQFDKEIREYTRFSSNTSDRQRARVKRKNVCKSNGVTRWRELESTYFLTSISARNTGTWAFLFERHFQPLFVGGFFSNQRESIVGAPRAYFRQKLKIDK